jgi:hypothetical protein
MPGYAHLFRIPASWQPRANAPTTPSSSRFNSSLLQRIVTTPAAAYPQGEARYARGWMVANDGAGSWWHSGSLPGSTALLVRNPEGSCAAAVCNTRSQPHQEMDDAMSEMLVNMERQRNL